MNNLYFMAILTGNKLNDGWCLNSTVFYKHYCCYINMINITFIRHTKVCLMHQLWFISNLFTNWCTAFWNESLHRDCDIIKVCFSKFFVGSFAMKCKVQLGFPNAVQKNTTNVSAERCVDMYDVNRLFFRLVALNEMYFHSAGHF